MKNIEDIFWSKIEFIPFHSCWEWIGTKYKNGYGYLNSRTVDGKRTTIGAHKYSYELHNGKIPEGCETLHSCNNRGCVNPDHLSSGTHQQNMKEVNFAIGERHGNSRWTKEIILEIRKRFSNGEKVSKLAEEFKTGTTNICRIVKRKSWKHI